MQQHLKNIHIIGPTNISLYMGASQQECNSTFIGGELCLRVQNVDMAALGHCERPDRQDVASFCRGHCHDERMIHPSQEVS